MKSDDNYKNITAMILAGGLGTRLRPVLADRPKVLAPVLGRPFLYYILDLLREVAVQKVILLTGYRAPQVEETIGSFYEGMSIYYSPERGALGTAGAARAAVAHALSSEMLLINGDSYCPVDLTNMLSLHREKQADLTMAAAWSEETERFGTISWNSANRITGFHEKRAGGKPGWINAGVYLLKTSVLQTIPANGFVSLEKDMIPNWMETGRRLLVYPSSAMVFDIGTPKSYRSANAHFRKLLINKEASSVAEVGSC